MSEVSTMARLSSFPNADIKILAKAGHDVHVEDRRIPHPFTKFSKGLTLLPE